MPIASICFFTLPTPGSMPITPDMPPIFAICASCSARSSRSKTPFRIRSAAFAAFSASMFCVGFLDEADDVAHAEDAAGDARRIEILERVELFADADQLDRLAGDGAHRQRRAAAPIAVDAGEHDAGDADAIVERLGEVDRVLAGQRVGDQQNLVRARRCLDLRHLDHQRLVDVRAAGGVEDDDVVAAEARRLLRRGAQSRPATARRRSAACRCRPARRARATAPAPPDGACRATPSALSSFCRSVKRRAILAAVVVLPEPCRPTSISATGAGALRSIACASEPSISTSWSLTILTTIWPGVTERTTSWPTARDTHLVGERADDIERHVGLDQRTAHLAHRLVDVGRRKRAALGQLVENAAKAFREGFEH